MAASSKPTGVHFALVFFVMCTLLLAIFLYISAKSSATMAQARDDANTKAEQVQSENSRLLDDLQTIRELLGVTAETVGNSEQGEAGAATIYGTIMASLKQNGGDHAVPAGTPNVDATLRELRSALNAGQMTNNQYQDGEQKMTAQLQNEQAAARDQNQALKAQADSSETELQKMITTQGELLAAKDREIQQKSTDLTQLQKDLNDLIDQKNDLEREYNDRIALLELANDTLLDRVNGLENLSFDKPDGKILRIENSTRRAWIDLGKSDYLREQVTFSVYVRNNRGVGRGREDIKAKIEVVEIQGPHMAECTIIDEDFDRPIQEGDPIYSPLFQPGQEEFFSFVGIVDIDGDGNSDRELLHSIITNAGGGIEVEVDDQGNRIPSGRKMSIKSKFLVVGDLPNPDDFAGFEERRTEAQNIQNEAKALKEEARQQGIRVIRFPDFLAFIGYQAKQRVFAAGETQKFNLKNGVRRTSTAEPLETSRFSTGANARRFGSNRE